MKDHARVTQRILGIPRIAPPSAASRSAPLTRRQRPIRRQMLLTPRVPRPVLSEVVEALQGQSAKEKECALRRLAAGYTGGSKDRVAAKALLRALADLAQQGWSLTTERGGLFANPPVATGDTGERASLVKERQRASLVAARASQLADPAVRDFLRRVETPTIFKGRRVSILNLVDDGHELAVLLRDLSRLPPSERGPMLRGVVQPEIEVIGAERKCSETGLSLMDVWRYFRHTWALEYRPTPGRTLMFLVRNAARPFRPIMGIASLANALPQLRVREEWIGWTPRKVLEAAEVNPASWPEQREALLRTLADAAAAIRSDDLLRGTTGKLKGEALEQRLYQLAGAAAAERADVARERQEALSRGEEVESLRNLPLLKNGEIDWQAASERPLFVHKRAKTLADVLFAQRVLSSTAADAATFLKEVSANAQQQRALAIALKEVRKVGLASRLLDLNVCGAVPPYGDLLVGKLVALAPGSGEIIEAYRERYRGQVSEIASQMAGTAIVRSPYVCAVTTTSLYAVAASQYNRLRVKVQTEHGEVEIRWAEIGETEGFGTVHLGEETVRALRELSTLRRGGRWVNNLFGEGNSARLRQIREGLEELGIETDSILRHRQFRKMYGLEVVPGGRRALRLNLPSDATGPAFKDIGEAWRARWLSARVTNRDVIARVSASGADTVRASLSPPDVPQGDLFATPARPGKNEVKQGAHRRVFMPRQPRMELIEQMYRDAASVADHHDPATVEALHIPTKIDDFIRSRATAGDVLFVTGNPGDGKTHLLKRLARELAAAKVDLCLDANEEPDEALIDRVDRACKGKRGCVVAINEGILVELVRKAQGRLWAKDVKAQLLQPFRYIGVSAKSVPQPTASRLKVLDLNQRNNLARPIVEKALAKLLSFSAPSPDCPGVGKCSGQFNVARISTSEVAERVMLLLDAIARTGFHATMRDLHGFLAYLLVGGTTCAPSANEATQAKPSPYWQHAFVGGQGPLFDAVRRLDPQHHTLPLLDDALWRSAVNDTAWLIPDPGIEAEAVTLSERVAHFISEKRRALFEHREGGRLLEQVGSHAERYLLDLLNRKSGAKELVRLLNRFFDRDEQVSSVLRLWVSHRYDARPSRYAASSREVATNLLEVRIPGVRPDVADAFEDFKPDHVLLSLREAEDYEGLRVDVSLLEALLAAEQGLPATFRRSEPEARISAFFDRLARRVEEHESGTTEVKFVDMNSGANFTLGVDIAQRRYTRSGR